MNALQRLLELLRRYRLVSVCTVLIALLGTASYYLWLSQQELATSHDNVRRSGEDMLLSLSGMARVSAEYASVKEAVGFIEANLIREGDLAENLGYFYQLETASRGRRRVYRHSFFDSRQRQLPPDPPLHPRTGVRAAPVPRHVLRPDRQRRRPGPARPHPRNARPPMKPVLLRTVLIFAALGLVARAANAPVLPSNDAKKLAARYALTKARINELLGARLHPEPLPATALPNPFYHAQAVANTAPKPGPVPDAADLTDVDTLAKYLAG